MSQIFRWLVVLELPQNEGQMWSKIDFSFFAAKLSVYQWLLWFKILGASSTRTSPQWGAKGSRGAPNLIFKNNFSVRSSVF